MVYLPAGVIFLSFYLLRWWFLPVILIGRTYISLQLGPAELILEMMIFNLVSRVALPIVAIFPQQRELGRIR